VVNFDEEDMLKRVVVEVGTVGRERSKRV